MRDEWGEITISSLLIISAVENKKKRRKNSGYEVNGEGEKGLEGNPYRRLPRHKDNGQSLC